MISSLTTQEKENEATINHVKNLGFNRSTGTLGESRALIYIQQQLSETKIKFKTEYFSFPGPRRLFMRLVYVIGITYLLLFKALLILIAIFSIKYLFGKLRKYSLVSKEESKNLTVNIPKKNPDVKPSLIIFSAHYDSTSSYLPYRLQIGFFFVFKFVMIPYIITSIILASIIYVDQILGNADPVLLFSIMIFNLVGQIILVTLALFLIYDPKDSQGSVDNASGVAILIELAKKLHEQPLENYDVSFLWTGAEEWGLIGSKYYYKRHLEEFTEKYDLNTSFNINIDMVGSYIGLVDKIGVYKKKINNDLNQIIVNTANDLGVPLVKYDKTLNPRSDHKKLRKIAKKSKSSFQVACIHSKKDSRYIHSLNDTPDKCSSEILNACVKLCFNTAKNVDKIKQNRIIGF